MGNSNCCNSQKAISICNRETGHVDRLSRRTSGSSHENNSARSSLSPGARAFIRANTMSKSKGTKIVRRVWESEDLLLRTDNRIKPITLPIMILENGLIYKGEWMNH